MGGSGALLAIAGPIDDLIDDARRGALMTPDNPVRPAQQERVREQLAAMLQGRGGDDAPAVDIDEF